ncbi:MAG: ASCH domain-containing protein [Desulforhopalus sp.]
MKTLILPVKQIYFEQIQEGSKDEEYRLVTPYWTKRLENKSYDKVAVTLGYPSKDDTTKRLEFPWCGVKRKTLQHDEFGPNTVEVFAIPLGQKCGMQRSLF